LSSLVEMLWAHEPLTDALKANRACGDLAPWIAEQPVVASECGDSCIAETCSHVSMLLAAALEEARASLGNSRKLLVISGPLSMTDQDNDSRTDLVSGQGLDGTWTETPEKDGDRITSDAHLLLRADFL